MDCVADEMDIRFPRCVEIRPEKKYVGEAPFVMDIYISNN